MPPETELTRFDHFMAEALYGRRGYYTTPKTLLGSRGDFTTTPKLDGRLAEKIASWIKEAWNRWAEKLPVIELGPGDGTLAADIHKNLPWLARRKLDYHFVEISPHLAERQRKLVPSAHHHSTLAQALAQTAGKALIISNEFFDAFPVRIFRRSGDELFLDSKRSENWKPAEEHPESLLFDSPPERFEVAESIQQWVQQNLTHLRRGEILTIDYGGDLNQNYHRRPLGTLRAYAHHIRFLPPEAYRNPGKQDLTFDVFFPDLIRWTEATGLKTRSYSTQSDFLGTNDQEGAGGAFKVLHQQTAP
jgi:SAM-dependent MidA family methyltransferase